MKLYRYLTEKELKHIIANEIEEIGSVYNDKESYKRINTHNYKKDVKYLHFYFDKKEISRINHLGFNGRSVCYVCEFEIPFYVIFPHIGIGKYDGHGYKTPLNEVYEVALPAKKMKQKYLLGYEKDKNSGPIDFGPIIEFDRRLFYDDKVIDNQEKQEPPLAYKAFLKKLEDKELEK